MCANVGRGPTVVSKRGGLVQKKGNCSFIEWIIDVMTELDGSRANV